MLSNRWFAVWLPSPGAPHQDSSDAHVQSDPTMAPLQFSPDDERSQNITRDITIKLNRTGETSPYPPTNSGSSLPYPHPLPSQPTNTLSSHGAEQIPGNCQVPPRHAGRAHHQRVRPMPSGATAKLEVSTPIISIPALPLHFATQRSFQYPSSTSLRLPTLIPFSPFTACRPLLTPCPPPRSARAHPPAASPPLHRALGAFRPLPWSQLSPAGPRLAAPPLHLPLRTSRPLQSSRS